MHAAPPFDQSPIPYVGGPRRAFVHAVHDGDTFWCAIDLGFGDHHSNPEKGCRLVGPNAKGFNTPELNASDPALVAKAKAARDRMAALTLSKFVYVESWPPTTDDKYGRWLMAVYVPTKQTPVELMTGQIGQVVMVNTGPTGVTGPLVSCFDLASQLVAEGLGEWKDFG
jgi:hypothetical protein